MNSSLDTSRWGNNRFSRYVNRKVTIKSIFVVVALMAGDVLSDTWTDPDTGYTWTYNVNGDTVMV